MPQDDKVVVYETPDGEMRMEAFVCFRWGKVGRGMSSKSPVRFVGRGLWNMAMFLVCVFDRIRFCHGSTTGAGLAFNAWAAMPLTMLGPSATYVPQLASSGYLIVKLASVQLHENRVIFCFLAQGSGFFVTMIRVIDHYVGLDPER